MTIAHAGHWLSSLSYLGPVAVALIALLIASRTRD